ncbi:MAG: hypothetical protein K6G28_05410, partial [Acholeplasmatales bacterium]|nr:hypothetical protein [Acholeplasmatales bacterium]
MNLIYKTEDGIKKITENNSDVEFVCDNNNNLTEIKIKALKDIKLIEANLSFELKVNSKDQMFYNGYQSWTDSFEKTSSEIEKNVYKYHIKNIGIKKFALDKYGDVTFYKYGNKLLPNKESKKKHGYDLFYIKGQNEMFIYNLNYKNA